MVDVRGRAGRRLVRLRRRRLGLYYYWYQSVDKTWPVFAALAYVVVTTVGALLASTAQRKPVVSALAIALMSAPVAAMAAAAVFYGAYVFGWIAR